MDISNGALELRVARLELATAKAFPDLFTVKKYKRIGEPVLAGTLPPASPVVLANNAAELAPVYAAGAVPPDEYVYLIEYIPE